jgi:hypothetical protein
LNSENPGDLFLINLLNAWVLEDGAVFGICSLSSSVTSSFYEFWLCVLIFIAFELLLSIRLLSSKAPIPGPLTASPRGPSSLG